MKKRSLLLVLIIGCLILGGCKVKETDALKFKNDYESLNNKETTTTGVKYRSIKIDKDNPIIYTTFKDVTKKIANKDTFILYVGFSGCPWCRSVIPYVLKEAKKYDIDKIYYVNVREDNTKESDLRGYYKVSEEGKVVYEVYPDKYYHDVLNTLNDFLTPYKVTDENNKEYETGENRLFAPTFIVYKKGKAKALDDCISEKQTDGYQKLTPEIEEDIKSKARTLFQKFSIN